MLVSSSSSKYHIDVHSLKDPYFGSLGSGYPNSKEAEKAPIRDEVDDPMLHKQNWKLCNEQKLTETDFEFFEASYGFTPSYKESTVTLEDFYNHCIRDNLNPRAARNYLISLFPILRWLPHYNFTWGYADLVAGITVGCVLVPQSMSYAQIATLPPQYGLYSSFVGAFTYSLFATSKDVCIGPVAVMSLQTAKVIAKISAKYPDDPELTGPLIATTLAFLCGIVAIALGVLRLGFLVELISLNAVAGFMTGSAINIVWSQVPALMGYDSLVDTRASTYHIVIDSLIHLPDTKLDVVFGLIPLIILYVWKWWCTTGGPNQADKHYSSMPKRAAFWKTFYFYAQAMRSPAVIVVFTVISWRVTRHRSMEKLPISILGTVPSGLKHAGSIKFPEGLLSKMTSEIPSSMILLVLEHIAISKSFGRINDYKVVPNQELIAIGATNLIGTFFHAYPATGSFSRSSLKAKCNVRTPLSGAVTGGCVLLALYCLTDAFFFIPKATLSAVIIHAVSDLLVSNKTLRFFWSANPLDCISFIITVSITVFSSIENGVYFAVCWSCAMLLSKQSFSTGRFLGHVEVAETLNPVVQHESIIMPLTKEDVIPLRTTSNKITKISADVFPSPAYIFSAKWLPFDHGYTRELNRYIQVLPPPPGVIVYRFGDSFTFVNCSRHYDIIFDRIKEETRQGELLHLKNRADRLWNDPHEWEMPDFFRRVSKYNKSKTNEEETPLVRHNASKDRYSKPILKVLCFDFSQVAQVDSTAIQTLVDLRRAVNKYADRQVEFHFAGIFSPWVKRSLVSAGFGTINKEFSDECIAAGIQVTKVSKAHNVAVGVDGQRDITNHNNGLHASTGTNFPFFHMEIPNFSKWAIEGRIGL